MDIQTMTMGAAAGTRRMAQRLAPLVAVTLVLGAGCGAFSTGTTSRRDGTCGGAIDTAGPTTAVLVDGRSPALDRLLQPAEQANFDPKKVWSALNDETPPGGRAATGVGIVLVAEADPAGDPSFPLVVDLRGEGNDATNREVAARGQARCLVDKLRALPPATNPPAAAGVGTPATVTAGAAGPNVVAALGAVAAQAREYSGPTGRVTLTVLGLGRSYVVGRPWSSLGLRDDQRAQIFAQLATAGVTVPSLAGGHVALYWVAPGEGAADDVIRSGLEALARDLCGRLGAKPCTVEE